MKLTANKVYKRSTSKALNRSIVKNSLQLTKTEGAMLQKNLIFFYFIVVLILVRSSWSLSEKEKSVSPEISKSHDWLKRSPCIVGTRWRTRRCRRQGRRFSSAVEVKIKGARIVGISLLSLSLVKNVIYS